MRRIFEVGGVIRPERKDCVECEVARDGVWFREAFVAFPASAEAASPRPLLRQLPKAAASWTAFGDAKLDKVDRVGKDCCPPEMSRSFSDCSI